MKKRWFVSGVMAGILVSCAAAASASEAVQAIIFPMKVSVNQAEQRLPEGTGILNYNNKTYVPLRFFAESLGAAVDYREGAEGREPSVSITSPNLSADWTLSYLMAPGYHSDAPLSLCWKSEGAAPLPLVHHLAGS
ncbi:stalk domain-containing protein [Paenibacillus sp. y28]|uniref:stalk domain-containing protein n=1 Tax=Paenibacillus sp. y28 TaxID=3129110 RepID=UPI003015F6C5